MNVILWALIALGVAFGVVFLAARSAQRRLPAVVLPPGEKMPRTALQQLAGRSLLFCLPLVVAAAGIVTYHGAQVYWDNDQVRLTVTGLLLAALAVFAFYAARVGTWTARDDGRLDERDRAILASAPAGQAPAMLVTLAAWMIGLVETYHGTHLVPSVYLYLIFWSCLMVSLLATFAGILIGYRRS